MDHMLFRTDARCLWKQFKMSAYTHTPRALGLPVCGGENKFFTLQPHGSRCGLSRRDFAFRGVVTAAASAASTIPVVQPPSSMSQDLEKLLFKPDGYNYWMWRGRKIHYVVEGEGFPIVLIHGFGASAYHWRYNIPEWAKNHKVYALDLIGFGWSEKAIIDYDALVWRDQVVDFLKEVVREPAVLVGNSLGGFTALVSAASMQDQVKGVVLLNTAGQFRGANDATKESEETLLQKIVLKPLKEAFQRVFLRFLFWQAKQPARIESVLKSWAQYACDSITMPLQSSLDMVVVIGKSMNNGWTKLLGSRFCIPGEVADCATLFCLIYVNSANVDDYLINSITTPADDPNAGEVYYRLMTRFMSNQRKYTLDNVLSQLSCPLLLVWGDLDPWVGPAKALRIKEFYPNSSLVNLQAGHCPHDEVPELVNKALLDWLSTINV